MAVFDSSKVTDVTAVVIWTDVNDKPARVDGMPVWDISAPIADMTPSPDGLSCRFVFREIGVATVTCKGDADLGEGVRELVLQGTLEFVPGEAVAGVMTFAATPVPVA
jgi:hypothetical protein